jgi:hypothetical protein
MPFGARNPFPFRLGGGKSTQQAIYESLNAGLGTAFDTTDESTVTAETSADARAIAAVWSANRRLANQWDPRRMTDMLARWEKIFSIRPGRNDSANRRRGVLTARFLALGGDTVGTLDEFCELILGDDLFIEVVRTPLADAGTNWPGGTPSNPDRWDSTVAHLLVRVERFDAVSIPFVEMLDRLSTMMTEMRNYTASWMETDFGWDGEGAPGFYLDEDRNLDGEYFDE